MNVDKNRFLEIREFLVYSKIPNCSLKIHVSHCLFSRLFEHDFNSTGTSTSPKRSVNELNAMLNVLLFSSHYTALFALTCTRCTLSVHLFRCPECCNCCAKSKKNPRQQQHRIHVTMHPISLHKHKRAS